MPFEIVKGNIVDMDVDAVVNAANKYLQAGGGVCGAIFSAAGSRDLQAACDALSPPIHTGEAVITPGFNLKAKYVIHAVGPIYNADNWEVCEKQLYSCYSESLKLARENECQSIAFPLISSGIYGYPKADALEVATRAITDFLSETEMQVYLMMFRVSDMEMDKRLKRAIEAYIHNNLTGDPDFQAIVAASAERYRMPAEEDSLEDLIRELDEPFNDTLLRLIREKGMSEPEVYHKANIDRKLFSKIRTGGGYMPGKRTILALSIALNLDLEETNALLEKAGYTLSHSQVSDVIVEYFISHRRYDIYTINEALFTYDQPLLGGAG